MLGIDCVLTEVDSLSIAVAALSHDIAHPGTLLFMFATRHLGVLAEEPDCPSSERTQGIQRRKSIEARLLVALPRLAVVITPDSRLSCYEHSLVAAGLPEVSVVRCQESL